MQKKIYIASSWKNQHAVEMLTSLLRQKDYFVYSWIENNYDEGYSSGTHNAFNFEDWMKTESAAKSFKYDTCGAMNCDLCIYIGPAGKDAAAEVGLAYASHVPVIGLYAKGEDFGLMRKLFDKWFDRYTDLLAELPELFNPHKYVPADDEEAF